MKQQRRFKLTFMVSSKDGVDDHLRMIYTHREITQNIINNHMKLALQSLYEEQTLIYRRD